MSVSIDTLEKSLKAIPPSDHIGRLDCMFMMMQSSFDDKFTLEILSKSMAVELHDLYTYNFSVRVVFSEKRIAENPLFVMSVYPTMDTVEKIVASTSAGKASAVQVLWEKNTDWVIEIDQRILDSSILKLECTELTAILLHEIGHIADSNAIASRVSNVLTYQMAKSPFRIKNMLTENVFRRIMALPVLSACTADNVQTRAALQHEIKADKFVAKLGRRQALISALNKLYKCRLYPMDPAGSPKDKIRKISAFSTDTLDEFQKRNDALVKRSLFSLKEDCNSPYMADAIQWVYDGFYTAELNRNSPATIKTESLHEKADKLADMDAAEGPVYEVSMPYVGIKKKLKKIDQNSIDYIRIKINSMKNEDDRYMILSYINTKLDIVEYYLSILNNPKLARKYDIPHTPDNLNRIKLELLNSRQIAIKTQIKKPYDGLYIAWPKGYEG